MESSNPVKSTTMKPKKFSELLPSLKGLLSEEYLQMSSREQRRPAQQQTHTGDSVARPIKMMTISQLCANLKALAPQSPNDSLPSASGIRARVSTVKMDNKTANYNLKRQISNNPVKKVPNVHSKPKPLASSRFNHRLSNIRDLQECTETPKFPKPIGRPKKSVCAQARINNIGRISGISPIPETPIESKRNLGERFPIDNKDNTSPQPNKIKGKTIINKNNQPKPAKSVRFTNKENNPNQAKINYGHQLSKPISHNPMKELIMDSPLNTSRNSNEDSFLQKELEITNQIQASKSQTNLELLAEDPIISTPSSNPFKEYRSVQEYFNNSSEADNSAMDQDNTLMSIDKQGSTDSEEIFIGLCELFDKATEKTRKAELFLKVLLEMKQQSESDIKMMDDVINMLNNRKQSRIQSLERIHELIKEHIDKPVSKNQPKKTRLQTNKRTKKNKTLLCTTEDVPDTEVASPKDISPVVSIPCSVIKSNHSGKSALKSPTYKIPRRNSIGLRKSLLVHKSISNVSTLLTPVKEFGGQALNDYMNLKKSMTFLSTPNVKRANRALDETMVTSINVQKQLNKLYNCS